MSYIIKKHQEIFENLFVLELANNHLGKLERGLKIVRDHAQIVRYNNIKAAIKLQFREVNSFIHPKYKGSTEERYIKKTEDTKLSKEDFARIINEIRYLGCIPLATPFDEKSVDDCIHFEMPIIKVASSDMNDWPLLEKIASTHKPTIVSTGGASEKDLDDLVSFFEKRNIPLAINHCVSIYPCEDYELELDQIDYFKKRYPDHIIGFSSHEYHDWQSSMFISYAKGARTWERHIDINYQNIVVSKYCSLPEQCDIWFKAFKKCCEMTGGNNYSRRTIPQKEIQYLDKLVRGVYAKKDLKKGYVFTKESFEKDFYLAIPLKKGQLSCREFMNREKLITNIKADQPLTINDIDGPYNENPILKKLIINRGL
jgi:N-acetylneuraminate synthase